ncbi:hypothetical protein ABLB90_18620 [Photorhabdus bodei]|nr:MULTISPECIES: hypothetical protein [Photorhabdus]MDB6369149.1 hypothetical protein [Photorhabdus bodei]
MKELAVINRDYLVTAPRRKLLCGDKSGEYEIDDAMGKSKI